MKIARFAVNGQIHEGVFEDGLLRAPGVGTFDPEAVTWLPPIARYDTAIGLALNYADHAAELKLDLPPVPILFNKMPNTLIGHRAPIVAPRGVEYMHYENE